MFSYQLGHLRDLLSMIKKFLFVEDNDSKFDEVNEVLTELLHGDWTVTRANSMVAAEKKILSQAWHFYLLDVSIDVTAGKAAFGTQSQATLGGLRLASTIAVEGLERPTVFITGFDAFSNSPPGRRINTVMDLNSVDQSARETLGDYYLGAVRYGEPGWREALKKTLKGAGL